MLGYNVSVPPSVRQALLSRSFDNDDLLPTIRTPVLIMHGAADAIVDPAAVDQHQAGMRSRPGPRDAERRPCGVLGRRGGLQPAPAGLLRQRVDPRPQRTRRTTAPGQEPSDPDDPGGRRGPCCRQQAAKQRHHRAWPRRENAAFPSVSQTIVFGTRLRGGSTVADRVRPRVIATPMPRPTRGLPFRRSLG